MIFDAVVKKVNLNKNQSRLEIFSPKYKEGRPLALLGPSFEGKTIKFITGWEDINKKERPFKINGGIIDDELIGKSTLIRGMNLQCGSDETIYIVMDPVYF